MCDSWFTGEMTLKSWRLNWHPVLKLLQNLISSCSTPVKVLVSLTNPCFHGLRTLIHFKEDYFMFCSDVYVCGSLCAHSHRRVVQMHVRWTLSSWQSPCASLGAPRSHSHSCEHSHAQAGGYAPHLPPNMLAVVSFAWETDLHLVWLHLCILESQSWNTLKRMHVQNMEYYPAPQP